MQSLYSLGSVASHKLREEAKVDIERWGRSRKRIRVVLPPYTGHSSHAPSHPTPPHPRSPLCSVLGPRTRENRCSHRLIAPSWIQPRIQPRGPCRRQLGSERAEVPSGATFLACSFTTPIIPLNPPASMSPTLFNPRNTASFLSRLMMVTTSCCCWSLGTSVSLVCPFDTPPHTL